MRFDLAIRELLLKKLGIKGSFNVLHLNKTEELSRIYEKHDGKWVATHDTIDQKDIDPYFANPNRYYMSGFPQSLLDGNTYKPGTNGLAFGPHGALRSNPDELLAFGVMMISKGLYRGERILSEAAVGTIIKHVQSGIGYGSMIFWHSLMKDTVAYGHLGAAYGMRSANAWDPAADLAIFWDINGYGVSTESKRIGWGMIIAGEHITDALTKYCPLLFNSQEFELQ